MSDLSTLTLDAALSEVSEWVAAHQLEQAIQRCNELLAAYPVAVRVIRARAQALEADGQAAQATDDYRRVLEILPTDEASLLGLARCLAATDQHSEAATLARQALDYAPQNAEALQIAGDELAGKQPDGKIARSRDLLKGGISGRAITLMRRMNEAEPDRTDVQVLLAEMLWRNGIRISSAELCQAILDDQPDCLNAHVILSAIWAQAGNADLEALHHRAIEPLDPDYRQTREWLGEASPLQPRDVPAAPNMPAPSQPAPEEPEEDGDVDRSAWVDDLIASSGPVNPLPPQAPAGESDVYAGEVTDTVPLEWSPAETDHAQNAEPPEIELPQWLRDLQASAARELATSETETEAEPEPAAEQPEPGMDAAEEEELELESPTTDMEVLDLEMDWLPAGEGSNSAPAEVAISEEDNSVPTEAAPGDESDITPAEIAASEEGDATLTETTPGDEGNVTPAEVIASEEGDATLTETTPDDEGNVMSAEVAGSVEDNSVSMETVPGDEITGTPVEAAPSDGYLAPTAEEAEPPVATDEAPIEEIKEPAAPPEGQTPVESNPVPPVADIPAPVKPARKHGRKGKGKSSKARPSNDEVLNQARKSLEAGRYDEAADHYSNLISAGKKLDAVLADLDVATHAYPDVRRFHALLGDVYTRKGDVNAALMAYHRALESH
jgi:tetratricopeptide (TPR) repeat protein